MSPYRKDLPPLSCPGEESDCDPAAAVQHRGQILAEVGIVSSGLSGFNRDPPLPPPPSPPTADPLWTARTITNKVELCVSPVLCKRTECSTKGSL